MVFDYMDHDLTGLMERRQYKMEVSHVSYSSLRMALSKQKVSDTLSESQTILTLFRLMCQPTLSFHSLVKKRHYLGSKSASLILFVL